MTTFTPPTAPSSMGGRYGMWSRYSIDVGQSVVRIGGLLLLHPFPEQEVLLPLVEGTDYFLGGRTYEVSTVIAAELLAAGFDLNTNPSDEDPSGYGEGGYGEGGYGA